MKKAIFRAFGAVLAVSVLQSQVGTVPADVFVSDAAGTVITSMDYFSPADGPVITKQGVKEASYGFVMPVFNGGAASWEEVSGDLRVNVLSDGKWQDIDSVGGFVYNSNWGHWFDGGAVGYWFKLSESADVQLASKSDPDVTLDYRLVFDKLDSVKVSSLRLRGADSVTADSTGGAAVEFPIFNGDESVTYTQAEDDLELLVRGSDGEFVSIRNNPASGWVYDQNFGNYDRGFWFNVTETTYFRVCSKSDADVFVEYKIIYNEPVRGGFRLSPAGETTVTADKKGAAGIVLPKIDGGSPVRSELDSFVYEAMVGGKWVSLDDPKSGFSFRTAGYSTINPATQWGYWADTVYGLWFQPVTEDVTIRVGYPEDGVKGHDCGGNYVTFSIVGRPDAPRPDPVYAEPLTLGTASDGSIDGWNMIWGDEFEGSSVDSSKWTRETGYFIGDDPYTWGWGNNELEHYTDSERNSFVSDGRLTIRLLDEPASFEPDKSKVALYSSGKLVSKDKFSFKYGRIDFCAKLPTGTGIWPALWMLPNDSRYGDWAASGEIDVMESKGRINDTVFGTVHYGGAWPANKHSGSEFIFSGGKSYDDGFHVYSCVWEKENIRWYVDGECYFVVPYTEWSCDTAADNPYAPFDEEFYVIMNLAAGGNFDGGAAPSPADVPSEMQVEYVRVYQAEGDSSGSFTDNSGVGNAAYLVRLHNYLLGRKVSSVGLDLDRDGVIDVYDLVLARKSVIIAK